MLSILKMECVACPLHQLTSAIPVVEHELPPQLVLRRAGGLGTVPQNGSQPQIAGGSDVFLDSFVCDLYKLF